MSLPARPGTRRARTPLRAALVALAALLATLACGPATASAATTDPADGWARVAHLSPDTAGVDVRLSGLAGGGVLHRLDGVSYGQVSDYLPVPAGTYVVSMVPTGAPEGTTPVVTQTVTVRPGQPVTVAAFGPNSTLATAVYADDLTSPPDGQARVRVLQASTRAASVDVSSAGVALAQDGATGATSGYATVPAGGRDLALGGDATGTARVDLAPGSVSTLLVLDDAAGRQTVKPVLDAAGPAATPAEGVDTGGGGLAAATAGGSAHLVAPVAAALVALLVGLLAGLLVAGPRVRRAPARAVHRR